MPQNLWDNDTKYFATELPEELGPKLVEKVQQYRYDTGVQAVDGRMAVRQARSTALCNRRPVAVQVLNRKRATSPSANT